MTTTNEPIDLYSEQASRILGIPGWKAFKWRAVPPDATILEGAVCTTLFKNGPRKGTPNWAKRDKSTQREIALSSAQITQFHHAWEKETGKCFKCTGTGQVFQRWSRTEGVTRKACPRCDGSGVGSGASPSSG